MARSTITTGLIAESETSVPRALKFATDTYTHHSQ